MGYVIKNHIFPGGKRKAFAEELSEEPQTFPIDAFLIGPDAGYTRDLLIAACGKRTPGKLQHPQIGYIDAKCKSFQVREVFDRVGKILVRMEFVEVEKKSDSIFQDLGVMDVLKVADELMTEAMLAFNEAMSIVDLPAYAIASTAGMINKLSNFVTSSNGLGRVADTATDIKDSLDSLRSEAISLLKSPEVLGKKVKEALDHLTGNDAITAYNSFKNDRSGLSDDAVTSLPVSGQRETKNTDAITSLICVSSLVVGVEKLIEDLLNTENLDELMSSSRATNKRDELVDIVQEIMETSTDSEFEKLHSLKALLLSTVPKKTVLPKTEILTIKDTKPSLILAYEKYEDIRMESDILRRNENTIVNPGEIKDEIEVVS